MRLKLSLALAFSLVLVFSASGAPDKPHRVFGEITDGSGNAVDIEGSFSYQGESVKEFETDSDGIYDVKVPNNGYEQDLSILIEGEEKGSLNFEPLGVSEKNFEYIEQNEEIEDSEQNTDTGSGGGNGGGGIAPPTTEKLGNKSEAPEIKGQNKTQKNVQNKSDKNKTDNISIKVEKDLGNISRGSKVQVELNTNREGGNKDSGSKELDNSESESSGSSVTSISFTSASDNERGNISVTESKNITDEIKEEVKEKPEGEVYNYVRVETNVNATNATFQFEISEEELSERNATPQQVVKQRYNGTDWNSLKTKYLENMNGSHRFQAHSPEGFSIFATTIQEKREKSSQKMTGSFFADQYGYVLLIILLVFAGLTVYFRRQLYGVVVR
jgi:PGF-pre-PGF domain-containing protein